MIGGRTSTAGFQALGVDAFVVRRPAEAAEVWARMNPSDYSIIFVTEPVYPALKDEIAALDERKLPVITVLPSVAGSKGSGEKELKKLVERAVGAEIVILE